MLLNPLYSFAQEIKRTSYYFKPNPVTINEPHGRKGDTKMRDGGTHGHDLKYTGQKYTYARDGFQGKDNTINISFRTAENSLLISYLFSENTRVSNREPIEDQLFQENMKESELYFLYKKEDLEIGGILERVVYVDKNKGKINTEFVAPANKKELERSRETLDKLCEPYLDTMDEEAKGRHLHHKFKLEKLIQNTQEMGRYEDWSLFSEKERREVEERRERNINEISRKYNGDYEVVWLGPSHSLKNLEGKMIIGRSFDIVLNNVGDGYFPEKIIIEGNISGRQENKKISIKPSWELTLSN